MFALVTYALDKRNSLLLNHVLLNPYLLLLSPARKPTHQQQWLVPRQTTNNTMDWVTISGHTKAFTSQYCQWREVLKQKVKQCTGFKRTWWQVSNKRKASQVKSMMCPRKCWQPLGHTHTESTQQTHDIVSRWTTWAKTESQHHVILLLVCRFDDAETSPPASK